MRKINGLELTVGTRMRQKKESGCSVNDVKGPTHSKFSRPSLQIIFRATSSHASADPACVATALSGKVGSSESKATLGLDS